MCLCYQSHIVTGPCELESKSPFTFKNTFYLFRKKKKSVDAICEELTYFNLMCKFLKNCIIVERQKFRCSMMIWKKCIGNSRSILLSWILWAYNFDKMELQANFCVCKWTTLMGMVIIYEAVVFKWYAVGLLMKRWSIIHLVHGCSGIIAWLWESYISFSGIVVSYEKEKKKEKIWFLHPD